MSSSRASAASPLLLGAVLAGVAFGAGGGTDLGRISVVEVALVLIGGALVAAAALYGTRTPLYGAVALLAFAGLAACTALAVIWSIVPDLTFVEAGRTLGYLAVFAGSVAGARLAPRAAPVVLGGVLLGAIAPVLYGLASRVWPATLAENELSNRLGQPFEYWNALGATAALCVPICLWLGSRRTGSPLLRALSFPALGMALLAILLTQSRGALAAAAVGAIVWFAVVPLRLRSLAVLIVPALGAGAVAAWALSKDPFSKALQPLSAKESVAGEFGLLVLLLALVLLAAGLATNAAVARGVPPLRARRRIGVAAVAVACLIPLAGLTSVAFSDRGLGGTVEELASETDTAPTEGGVRVAEASSTRGKYWREAGRIFDERAAVGTGPGTFRVARLRHRNDIGVSGHAHGFVPQTMADLGLIGLGLTALLLVGWLVAAARTTALYPRRRGQRRDWSDQRVALVALALVALVFGVQSTIDWTWFVPGPTAMALVAAGFVAGRGPATAATVPAAPRAGRRRPDAPRIVAAVAVAISALLCVWAIWQPESSDRASNEAIELTERGDYEAAIAKAEDAADLNPLTPKPLYAKAAAQVAAGDVDGAQKTLEDATLSFPGDPQTWVHLARFELVTADRPRAALDVIAGALYLDPRSIPTRELFLDARIRLREKLQAPNPSGG